MERNRTFERRHVLGARWGRAVELEPFVSRMVPASATHLFHGRIDFVYPYVHVVGLVVEFRVDASHDDLP